MPAIERRSRPITALSFDHGSVFPPVSKTRPDDDHTAEMLGKFSTHTPGEGYGDGWTETERPGWTTERDGRTERAREKDRERWTERKRRNVEEIGREKRKTKFEHVGAGS